MPLMKKMTHTHEGEAANTGTTILLAIGFLTLVMVLTWFFSNSAAH